jgi:cytochrome c oxidase subunit 2
VLTHGAKPGSIASEREVCMPVILFSLLALLGLGVGPAYATGPTPWEMGFQPPATPVMDRMEAFNTFLFWIIVLITTFVLVLLIYVCIRFAASRHPTPSRRTHNTLLEIAWTTVPVLILVVIAIPSFKLLYFEDVPPKTALTIKATGHQWYWTYEYPDNGDFTFDANLVTDADLKPGQPRLLTTDNPLVVPVDTNILLHTTSTDVIHSWAVPSFGVKIDAIPGRINHSWFRVEKPGMYYGQCSELCGIGHGFMPIMVKAVPKDEFEKWVKQAKQKYASAGTIDLAKR